MIKEFGKEKNQSPSVRKGFSLMEVMIALFVLVVGVLTTITLTVNSITQTTDSRDSLVAAALVQEGTELARSVRDENATQKYYNDSLQLFRHFKYNRRCALDYVEVNAMRPSNDPFSCGGGGGDGRFDLYLDTDDRYSHNASAAKTEFSRSLFFRRIAPEKEIEVISTVTWNNEDLPSPSQSCSLANSCVRNTSTLTSWILH